MDEYQRRLQQDHSANLKAERAVMQACGVTRSRARAALKQAVFDRQLALDRQKAAPIQPPPPAPKIEVREVKLDPPRAIAESDKKIPTPQPVPPPTLGFPTTEGVYVYQVDDMGEGVWVALSTTTVSYCNSGASVLGEALVLPTP